MSDPIRPYLHYSPTLGKRVMIDGSSVIIGNVILGDDLRNTGQYRKIRGHGKPVGTTDRIVAELS